MNSAIAIAWRNVARNRRRSLITMASIAVGLVALLFLWGFNDGSYSAAIDNYRLRYTGSIQIHADGYFRQPRLETHLADVDRVVSSVEQEGVDTWTTRLTSFALVAGETASTGMSLTGIDPLREPTVSTLDESLAGGRYLTPEDSLSAMLGTRAAERLQVDVGDDIVLLTSDSMGAMAAERLEVVGIFTTGDPALDELTVFAPLSDVQRLLAMEDRVTHVVAQVPEPLLDAKVEALRSGLADAGVEVLPWDVIAPLVLDAQALDRAFAYIFLGIVVAIAVSGIANAVLMSMMQRTREFGVMLALGTQRATIASMIVLETMILGVGGIVLGTAVGLGLLEWLGTVGVDISGQYEGMEEIAGQFALDTVVYPEINTDHLALTIGLMVGASVLSALYPMLRAVRLQPVEAIRHV